VSRLPLRTRLTLAFALATAVVLVAVGALLYVRLGDALAEQVDDALEARAATLAPLVRANSGTPSREALGTADDEGLAQVLTADGALLASSPALRQPLLDEQALAAAREKPTLTVVNEVSSFDGADLRLRAGPIVLADSTVVLVVGASLEDREEALGGLLAQLAVVGPLALLAAALGGYLLAGAALAPVEAMRRQAILVTSESADRRLSLPFAQDEIRRLGETLNEMLGRLEAGLVRERRFVADASHELRTPLSLLQTELDLALRRPRSHAELEAALRSASEETQRLSRLADDLLVLAQADEGRLGITSADVPLGDLIATVVQRFQPRAADSARTIELAVGVLPTVVGDRLRLEQALGNLIDNALRHGGGTIRVEAARRDDRVELRVGDEGPGVPQSLLPRAFERFARADAARPQGAGLGLAIVEAIIRAHGGTVAASGAVVTIALPAR